MTWDKDIADRSHLPHMRKFGMHAFMAVDTLARDESWLWNVVRYINDLRKIQDSVYTKPVPYTYREIADHNMSVLGANNLLGEIDFSKLVVTMAQ